MCIVYLIVLFIGFFLDLLNFMLEIEIEIIGLVLNIKIVR